MRRRADDALGYTDTEAHDAQPEPPDTDVTFAIDRVILIAAVLVLFAVASSKFSARLGLPVLVIFLGLGMLAGSEGIGGIAFENYTLAHAVGTIALALILFDGGLRTSLAGTRSAAGPALTLATLGVVLTAAITGAAAAWLLDLPLLEAFLLGGIVGSTDAAAVFAIMRGHSLHVEPRVANTLEIESGANDPMAVFLTIALLELLVGEGGGASLLMLFVRQLLLGAGAGLLFGWLGAWMNRRINLDAAGLYPLLATVAGMLAFGSAAVLGGSGFLAVYIAGLVIGNSGIVFKRGIFLFSDGMAWLAQIAMFLVLGLLSFPSRLLAVAPAGLLVAAVLIFIARPVACALILLPFRYDLREIVFIAWGGLKGAVPVILAIYPLLFGLPDAPQLFNLAFFAVLVSAVAQGWTLPPLARRLGLERPGVPEPSVSLEITSVKHVDGDIVAYRIEPDSRIAGRLIRELALPENVVVAMIARGNDMVPPRGTTRLEPGDHVFVVMRQQVRPLVDRVFALERPAEPDAIAGAEFPLSARTSVGDLREYYGISVGGDPTRTLEELLRERLGAEGVDVGSRIVLGDVVLFVRELDGDRIETVGLSIATEV